MTGPLRIGWIGCGTQASEMLLPQLVRHEVELAALCDIDASKLAAVGARYGVAESARFTDFRALLARELDAVGIAVGPRQHAAMAIAALQRGLPVFIEKPPGGDAAEARAIQAAAQRAGRPVVVGFMKRFSTANRIAANIVRGAAFGPRASFLGEYMTAPTYFARDPDYSGFYLHHCVHYLDLVPYLMGEPRTLAVRRHEMAPGKLLLHVHLTFAEGGLATLVMGTHQSRATPMEWWQVMGDNRRVEVRNVHEVRYIRASSFKVGRADATLDDASDTLVWEPNLTVAANEDHKGFHALLGAFVAAARGAPVEVPGIADGVRAMLLLEAMTRAAGSGETVTLG